ncbi:P3h1 [Symbiodinium sp. CCMP2456]|nr:P3h1 [Symbiodinium sp. CCMP2456]
MDRAASVEHCIREGLLPEELCRELRLLHLVAGVPGYRPNCTACTLLACPKWGWPALLRARELARDAAEDFFDEFGGLWPETTATVCWFPGSSLPVHTDDCKEYLSKRHVSVVIWLSSRGVDFEGGDFFFEVEGASGESQEVVSPRAGNAALFRASERHGLRTVLRGARLALNIWFTRDPSAAEDSRLLGPEGVVGLGSRWGLGLSQRLFGAGPQRTWPEDEASGRLAKRTLAQANLPPRGRALRPRRPRRLRSRRCQEAGLRPVSKRCPLPHSRRALLAVAAHRKLLAVPGSKSPSDRSHGFFRLVWRRERQVRAALPRWHQHGLLSIGPLSSPHSYDCQSEARCCSALVERNEHVPGLTIARGALGSALQRRLKKLADGLMTSQEGQLLNQSMRFGSDVPPWAYAIVRRIRRLPGFFTKSRVFDQLIVNAYRRGEVRMPYERAFKGGLRAWGFKASVWK